MTECAGFSEKLIVVTNVVHYEFEGQLYAYTAYAREIDIWGDMFDQISIAAPYRTQKPPSDCGPFKRSNLRVIPQRALGGDTLGAKIKLALGTPLMAWDLSMAMRQGDAVHVRCPSNLGLLATILAPMCSKKMVCKFAGQWSPARNEPWSTRFQRFVLNSRWWQGPVTVYGRWPNQPPHVVSFFSSAFTEEQISRFNQANGNSLSRDPRKILFVGRLAPTKNVDVLLEALAKLQAEKVPFTATIVGEGTESIKLQRLSASLGLSDCVKFKGAVSSDGVIEFLERSSILVLASEAEGWPKAIVEAMTFGLVTIGSNVGWIPEILGDGRGLTVPPRDANLLAATLRDVLVAPEKYSEMRARAAEWARPYSLEFLRDSLRSVLEKHWHVSSNARTKL